MKRTILCLMCFAAVLVLAVGCAPKVRVPPQPPILPPPEETPRVEQVESLPPPAPRLPEQVAMLKTVHFDFDRSVIRAGDAEIMYANSIYLKDNPTVRVALEGYCDPIGTDEYNRGLGLRRANSAKAHLVKLGIDAGRLSVISYGKERLVTTDPARFELNRRVEFLQK